ncbi:MAG: hypothetical protein ACYC0B_02000 [Gemmatimonadaceae bacterium]
MLTGNGPHDMSMGDKGADEAHARAHAENAADLDSYVAALSTAPVATPKMSEAMVAPLIETLHRLGYPPIQHVHARLALAAALRPSPLTDATSEGQLHLVREFLERAHHIDRCAKRSGKECDCGLMASHRIVSTAAKALRAAAPPQDGEEPNAACLRCQVVSGHLLDIKRDARRERDRIAFLLGVEVDTEAYDAAVDALNERMRG